MSLLQGIYCFKLPMANFTKYRSAKPYLAIFHSRILYIFFCYFYIQYVTKRNLYHKIYKIIPVKNVYKMALVSQILHIFKLVY